MKVHDSDSKDPGSIPDSVTLGLGPGRNGTWDDPTLSLACPNYGSGRFIRNLTYKLDLTEVWSVTERNRRDRVRDGRGAGDVVSDPEEGFSGDRRGTALRDLDLATPDVVACLLVYFCR